jgi:hypothetical protein
MSNRRYYSEQEIIALIDKAQASALLKSTQADVNEAEAKDLFRRAQQLENISEHIGAAELRTQGKHHLENADKLRVSARNLIEKKCRKLKEKLSEFRTEMLPFTGQSVARARSNDRSIPAL